MLKNYNKIDELDQETLASDMDFIEDASLFLSERAGINKAMTPKEIYEEFMEHMRYQNVNEVTAIRDLEYAQNADLEGKQRFGRLIDAYDKVDEDFSGRMMWDYASGLLTAPSTYIGIATGGTGKAAAVAGTQATKFGIRKVLSGALKAAVVEGAIGAGQGVVQEKTRVETDLQDEIDYGRVTTQGLMSAGTAGLINLPVGALQVRQANKANELYESAKLAQSNRANEASIETAKVLKKAGPKKVKETKEILNQLDPTKVAEGRRIKKDLMPGDTMEAALGSDVVDNITAAAIQIKDKLKLKKGDRITTGLHRLLDEGKLTELEDIQKVLGEHNLTMDQFSLVFLSEISEAGKTLGSMSRLSKVKGKTVKTEVGKMLDELDNMNRAGVSGLSADDVVAANASRKVSSYIKDLDKLRLGAMTSQLATTMRNNINGGMRIGIDASTRMFDNLLNLRNPFDGTFDTAKYALNPYEGKVIERLMKEAFPEEGRKLFREAADLAASSGSDTPLAVMGRKINYLNTVSDNFFKRAMISASLKRRLGDKNIDLNEVIAKGEFGRIPDDILKDSIQDAYEFTYQSSMKGDDFFSKMSRGVIKSHQEIPFVISAFMPFPRFVANQLKFVYEHAPLIGMLPLDRLGSKLPARTGTQYVKDKLPKQLTGMLMLGTAYAWRAKQGDDVEWYEMKDNKGDIIDGRAVYGPFAPFMLAADLMYRSFNNLPAKPFSKVAGEAGQALLGSTLRTGLGLYAVDKMIDDYADGKGEKILAESIGNVINTFTLPAATVRDFYSQFDPKSRMIPETRTGERKPDEDLVNFLDVIQKRAGRSLPDLPLKSWTEDTPLEQGFKILSGDDDYDQPLASAFQTGDVKAVNPLEKQMFGLTKKTKNEMQREMSRLGYSMYDIYKRDKNDTLDLYTRQELSKDGSTLNLEQRMSQLMNSTRYKDLSVERQKLQFKKEAQSIITEAKEIARDRIEGGASLRNLPYSELVLQKWIDQPRDVRAAVEREYRDKYGGKSVTEDRNETVEIEDGVNMNVLQWANETAKAFGEN